MSSTILRSVEFRRLCLLGAFSILGACNSASSPEAAGPSETTGTELRAAGPQAATPITEVDKPSRAAASPLKGAKLYVDPSSSALAKAASLQAENPEQAKVVERIGKVPQAVWLGEWSGDVRRYVSNILDQAEQSGELVVFIAYNVPYRDCGLHSKGGLSGKDAYQQWIREVRAGIAGRPTVVVLEPDALGHLQECLSEAQKSERFQMIKDAVWVLRQDPSTGVYIDAGHPRWVPAPDMAERLKQAGVEDAHGFALNTSNYVATDENLKYGRELSALVGGAHFVVDTSRNGNGSAPGDEWCNPKGRKIGQLPTSETGEPLADAFLWLKRPGESDGECNGGPPAGQFWLEQALELGAE